MLEPGATAPTFRLPGSDGGPVREYGLADSDDAVVLSFYTFDFHPTCTEQMCSLADVQWLDLQEGVRALGVSVDGAYSHREFAAAEHIDYPLLSDSDGSVADAYGVLADGEVAGHAPRARRAVFVIDPSRTIRFAWMAGGPDEQPDLESIRATVDAI